ncbi:MAG TPA: hypothetical protein VGE15_06205, partial [Sphingobacteriaceae bacterium]
IQDTRQAWTAGTCWMVLTVIFEFSLGKILRRPWKELLQQYNVIDGQIWPVFLLFLLLLPYLLYLFS